MDSNLREKIIREQDKLIYFSYSSFEEGLLGEHIDDQLDFSYSEFNSKFLAENLDIIKELKSKNLLYLLTSNNNEVKDEAKRIIMERVKDEGEHFYSGENVKFDLFGVSTNLWLRAFSSVGKSNSEYIKDRILESFNKIKDNDPYAYSIISKAGYITSMDNFFCIYEQGVFTPEKLQFLEKLANENPNILDSINYRIFEDSIFEMGEEFVSRIARYPNVSNKLVMIAENNPKLLKVIKQGFSELEETKKTPEILAIQNKVITYAVKNYSKIEDISFEELANRALRVDEIGVEKAAYASSQEYEAEFDRICDQKYEKLSQNFNANKYSNAAPEKKKILLMKYFGMDKISAETFCNRFMHDIDSIEVTDGKAKEFLERVKSVLSLETEAEVDNLYYSMTTKITPLERLHYEYALRESYAQTYVDAIR